MRIFGPMKSVQMRFEDHVACTVGIASAASSNSAIAVALLETHRAKGLPKKFRFRPL